MWLIVLLLQLAPTVPGRAPKRLSIGLIFVKGGALPGRARSVGGVAVDGVCLGGTAAAAAVVRATVVMNVM